MIDMKPAPGRYIFSEPSVHTDFVGRQQGVIRELRGKRIVFTDDNGNERFMYRFAAVCDTNEEIKLIRKFSKDAANQVKALVTSLTFDWNNLIGGDK